MKIIITIMSVMFYITHEVFFFVMQKYECFFYEM